MPDERWQRVEELFFAAADLHGPARTEFLEQACGSDSELRREAESLLDTDTLPCDSISVLIESAATSLLESDVMEGVRLGSWRIIREIGRGGMGAVYLAGRADDQFDKQAAIKLVKRGIDTDSVLNRFRRERRILAGLDHPNIARLIDGGTSTDGRPYFVMEFIEGIPIHQFCEQRKLTARARCELFRKVCEPVSFAHRQLVIHRDLKPANILVTADGVPKLLDFGIARLLTPDRGESTSGEGTVELTMSVGVPLTPAYASPEQVRGEPVNTTSDVFSLGAILAKLLTGQQQRDRDLDKIVQMATHADPARRYQSVDHFSEDLRRYLTGLPVMAQDDSLAYRFGKFMHRNRLSVLVSGLILLTLIAGIGAVLWEARQTRIQRQRAEARLGELVEMANRTLFRVDGSIERIPGATQARRDMVRGTLDYLDRLNAETSNDERVLSALASAYARLARIEGNPLQPNLGDLQGSEQSYRKAAKILDALIAARPDDTSLRLARADCSKGLAEVLDTSGRRDAAVIQCHTGLLHTSRILEHDPRNLAARKSAVALHLTSIAANRNGNHLKEARAEALEQLGQTTQMATEYPQDTDCILNLASALSQLGSMFTSEGQVAEGLVWFRKSVALREQVFALHPNDVAVQRDLMIAYGHVGDSMGSPFLLNTGDPHGAMVWYEKAARIAQAMAASDPSDTQARIDLGVILMRIGTVLEAPGEVQESLDTFSKSAAILDKVAAENPTNVTISSQTTLLYEYKARRLISLGDFGEAKRSYQRSFDICDAVMRQHAQVSCERQMAIDEAGIAAVDARLGHREEALREAASALARGEAATASGTGLAKAYLPRALGWYGDTLRILAGRSAGGEAADWKAAAELYRKSLVEWGKIDPSLAGRYTSEVTKVRRGLTECLSHLPR